MMPFDVIKRGNKWVVLGPGGKVHGTHATKAKALAQQRAMYANVPEARKK